MQDFQEQLITFIKGLMQPSITVFVILVGAFLVFGNKIDPNQAWWLVVGVFGFWFGKTVGLFGNGKAPEITAESNAGTIANLTSVVKAQQNTINNATLDLGASVPLAAVQTPVAAPAAPPVPTAPAAAGTDDPDTVLAQLAAELDKEANNG